MAIKALPWSWTSLSEFETCPFRALKVRIQKVFREEETEQLAWGKRVHTAFQTALRTTPASSLPEEMAPWQGYVDRLSRGVGELLTEQKFALTKDFRPTEYFGPAAWYRGQADAVRLAGPIGLAVDWKTGKRKINPGNKQLMLMAACLFAHHPELEIVQSKFVWLNEDKEDDELYTRERLADEWANDLLPRVQRMLDAAATETYLPQPGGLCKSYCPVTSCQFHGRGSR